MFDDGWWCFYEPNLNFFLEESSRDLKLLLGFQNTLFHTFLILVKPWSTHLLRNTEEAPQKKIWFLMQEERVMPPTNLLKAGAKW